jgi:hypothetical protein
MPQVCAIRCRFRDTRLQRKVNALLKRGHSVQVLCLRDTGERLREGRGRQNISRMPIRQFPATAAMLAAPSHLILEVHRHGH